MEKKKILIVSYTFPPTPGIGGRRWVKFSKYLYKKGHEVKIISAKIKSDDVSSWVHDIYLFDDKIEYIPSCYPHFLTIEPRSIFQKIMYRFSLLYAKLKTKGNYYDRSAFWKSELIKKVKEYVKDDFKTIICTGAPFYSIHHLLDIKREFNDVKLIADLRDPWLGNSSSYGFKLLSQSRRNYESRIINNVVNNYDAIISVYDEMTSKFTNDFKHCDKLFYTIPNGFDREDFNLLESDTKLSIKDENKIKFLFAGSFYPAAKNVFKTFLAALDELRNNYETIFKTFHFEFFGNISSEIKQMVQQHENIIIGKHIPLSETYKKIRETDFMMLFLMDEMNYSLSTKFYEYIANNKPIVLFANGGEAGKYVEENNLGYFADTHNTVEVLKNIYYDHKKNKVFSPLINDELNQFDIDRLTDKLVSVLNEVS